MFCCQNHEQREEHKKDLPFFWLMFCSESFEQLDEYKKDLLLDEFVLLRYTFFLLVFSSEIFEDLHRTKNKVESFNLSLFDDDNKDYLLSLKIYQWTLTTPSLLAAKFKEGFITVHLQEKVTFASSKAYSSVKR
ncbi:hypothetical protein DEO72_LG5g1125 [Vigna unguiculata]|uniref:Uncharacterized protein n=1 Tax=Vigna unguiculata TaxID=3917 RepID=A0A4D6LYW5_VIGUN|nr:hypothetical protein DEO72_LG5g1125 [Vigna unguiculata]